MSFKITKYISGVLGYCNISTVSINGEMGYFQSDKICIGYCWVTAYLNLLINGGMGNSQNDKICIGYRWVIAYCSLLINDEMSIFQNDRMSLRDLVLPCPSILVEKCLSFKITNLTLSPFIFINLLFKCVAI